MIGQRANRSESRHVIEGNDRRELVALLQPLSRQLGSGTESGQRIGQAGQLLNMRVPDIQAALHGEALHARPTATAVGELLRPQQEIHPAMSQLIKVTQREVTSPIIVYQYRANAG